MEIERIKESENSETIIIKNPSPELLSFIKEMQIKKEEKRKEIIEKYRNKQN